MPLSMCECKIYKLIVDAHDIDDVNIKQVNANITWMNI